VRFFIQGTPKPQARPRFARRGKFVSTYSVKNEWKEVVKKKVKYLNDPGFCTAIEVNLYFWFHRPKSHYGTGKNADKLKENAPKWHTKKPDKDNLEKAVTDALVDAGLLSDDSIIVRGMTSKSYITPDEESGCWVDINQL
jgi:Holliday junction resolvase RusA-like endonuclease